MPKHTVFKKRLDKAIEFQHQAKMRMGDFLEESYLETLSFIKELLITYRDLGVLRVAAPFNEKLMENKRYYGVETV